MTLSDFATLSTAISGLAVTASLLYLAIQTRQNVRHTRALIHQGASARTTSIILAQIDADHSAAWIEGNGAKATPDAVRKVQFFLMCGCSITALEDIFSQHNDGLMEEEVFARNCQLHSGLLTEPGYRAYWNAQRAEIAKVAPKFCAFVDGLCVGEPKAFGFRLSRVPASCSPEDARMAGISRYATSRSEIPPYG
jgi:hypothetical protein